MFKLSVSILFLFVSCFSMGQSIGLRSGVELTNLKQTNWTYGGGAYIAVNGFSGKISVLFSADYFGKSRKFYNLDLQTTFTKYSFSAAALYLQPISQTLDFTLGPAVGYSVSRATHQGIISRWIEHYNSNFIDLGLASGIHLKNVHQSPFSIDFFMTPAYSINLSHNKINVLDGSGTKPDYSNNYFNLNIQLGVTYTLKTNYK